MATFAKIDENNSVIKVVSVHNNVITDENGILIAKRRSQVQQFKQEQEPILIDKHDSHLKKNKVGEPKKW